MLKGKKIVLGITGSIAAYKACMIIRGLIKEGAEVQVVITASGKEFITPITLSALTSKPVISDFFSQRDGTWNSHVSLGQWADAMLIAPCTASSIGKMANGIADNMLVTTYLSMKAPVFIAPAMDQSAEEVYREYVRSVLPYQVGNSHPRFWGWVAGSGTVMGTYAELLAASTDAVSGAFSYMSNNYVEMQVVDWCRELLGFPPGTSGLITSGCSSSTLIGLAVARNTMAGFDVRAQGMHGAGEQMTLYCSEEVHSSVQKAVELLGFGND